MQQRNSNMAFCPESTLPAWCNQAARVPGKVAKVRKGWVTAAQARCDKTVVLDCRRQLKNMPNNMGHDISDPYVPDTSKCAIMDISRADIGQPSDIKINEGTHSIHNNRLPVIVVNSLKPLAARLTHIITSEINRFSKKN